MSGPLTDVQYDAALVAARDAFLADLRTVAAGAPVPTLYGWTVTDLGEHLARVHRWASAIVGGSGPRVDPPTRPTDAPIADWYAEAAAVMLEVFRACPDDRECWTFAGPGTVAFWWRRQAHETAMHSVDLGTALGRPLMYPTALAVDGVEEVLDSMMPGQHRQRPITWHGAVALTAADAGVSWRLEPASAPSSTELSDVSRAGARLTSDSSAGHGPPRWERSGEPADVTVSANASDLVLGLWGRRPWRETWTVTGDTAVLDAFMANRLVP